MAVPDYELLSETFRTLGQYLYDDSLQLGDYCKPESVERVRALKLDHDDVIITSYPKTGTTFLQECVWLIRNNADVELAQQDFTYNRTPFVEDTCLDNITAFYNLPKPRSLKTHLPYRLLPLEAGEKRVKIIYIYRNPRDNLVSFYHFYRATKQLGNFPGTWDDFFDMFYRVNKGLLYYGNIYDHIRGYWEHKHDPNLLILSFEDLLRNHKGNIMKIADFLKVQLDENQVEKIVKATSFESMKENPKTNMTSMSDEFNPEISKFMRKGEIGDWLNYFTEEQLTKLKLMEESKLGDLNINFVYE